MKKLILAALIALICLSLVGCSLNLSSVESLMRPPKLSGESRLLQQAFEKSVVLSDSIIMKTPINGDYRSSYLMYDFENDGVDEAIVFYSDILEDNLSYASVFKMVDEDWQFVSKIKGKCEDVYEVNFADINGDGISELCISWSTPNSVDIINSSNFIMSNNRVLTVYSYDGIVTPLLKSENYTDMYLGDFNNDKSDEIFIVNVDLSDLEKKTVCRILGFDDNYSVSLDYSVPVSGMLEIYNIITDSVVIDDEAHTRIFVDGAVSEIGVITEIIDIKQESFDITLPIYELNQSNQPVTLRDSIVLSADIDDDGIVEVPTLEKFPYALKVSDESNEHSSLNLTVWSEIIGSDSLVDFKCIFNGNQNYYIKINDDFLKNVSAIYNSSDSTLSFYYVDYNGTFIEELFSIRAFLKLDWEENNFNYNRLFDNGTFVYGYIINSDKNEYEDYIKENFNVF